MELSWKSNGRFGIWNPFDEIQVPSPSHAHYNPPCCMCWSPSSCISSPWGSLCGFSDYWVLFWCTMVSSVHNNFWNFWPKVLLNFVQFWVEGKKVNRSILYPNNFINWFFCCVKSPRLNDQKQANNLNMGPVFDRLTPGIWRAKKPKSWGCLCIILGDLRSPNSWSFCSSTPNQKLLQLFLIWKLSRLNDRKWPPYF